MLEIRNISKKYSKTVLDNVSFLVEEGMVCGLFGANGAGKSTLLKIIAGLEIPSGGEVLWDGRAILPGGSPKIGAMIESPCFFPGMSGYENLRLLAHLAGDCKDEAVLRAIKAVGLSSQKDILFKKYSLGMKQRLYFAFAFMRKPSLLVLRLLSILLSGLSRISHRPA
jgi:ABC-type multidrug transport system ATPase subunit